MNNYTSLSRLINELNITLGITSDTEDCNKLYAYVVVEYFKSQRGDKHEHRY